MIINIVVGVFGVGNITFIAALIIHHPTKIESNGTIGRGYNQENRSVCHYIILQNYIM